MSQSPTAHRANRQFLGDIALLRCLGEQVHTKSRFETLNHRVAYVVRRLRLINEVWSKDKKPSLAV